MSSCNKTCMFPPFHNFEQLSAINLFKFEPVNSFPSYTKKITKLYLGLQGLRKSRFFDWFCVISLTFPYLCDSAIVACVIISNCKVSICLSWSFSSDRELPSINTFFPYSYPYVTPSVLFSPTVAFCFIHAYFITSLVF